MVGQPAPSKWIMPSSQLSAQPQQPQDLIYGNYTGYPETVIQGARG